MSLFDRLTNRALAWLGLDFDFSLDLLEEPFHSITDALVLGSRPRPEQLPLLQTLGVTHVVSCLEPAERARMGFLDAHFETQFLPLRDGVNQDIGGALTTFFGIVDTAGPQARVLVHCEVGVSRSATLATAQVMRAQRLRFYEAYRTVRTRRPQVLPNVAFATELQRLEHRLFPEPRDDGYSSLTRYLHEVCHVPVEVDVLQDMLEHHDYDGLRTIRAIFGDEVPRVVQGVRL